MRARCLSEVTPLWRSSEGAGELTKSMRNRCKAQVRFFGRVMHVLCYLGRRTRCLDDGTLWYLLPFASASSARFASTCHLPVEMSGAGEYSSGASLDFASNRVVLHRIALFCISAGICGYLFDVTSVRYFGDYAHRGFSPLTSDIESIASLCPPMPLASSLHSCR